MIIWLAIFNIILPACQSSQDMAVKLGLILSQEEEEKKEGGRHTAEKIGVCVYMCVHVCVPLFKGGERVGGVGGALLKKNIWSAFCESTS